MQLLKAPTFPPIDCQSPLCCASGKYAGRMGSSWSLEKVLYLGGGCSLLRLTELTLVGVVIRKIKTNLLNICIKTFLSFHTHTTV